MSTFGLNFGKTVKSYVKGIGRYNREFNNGVENITVQTANYLATAASRLTPVDTGKAKRSWAVKQSLKQHQKGRRKTARVFNTARTAADNSSGPYYIWFVNNGTRNIRPRRFFERAVAQAERYQNARIRQLQARLRV